MKLPSNSVIAPEKLTQYLLVPQRRSDKSGWLALAGYQVANWRILESDLRTQILVLDAKPLEQTVYGQMFEITGHLRGPNGQVLSVRTIWMTETATGITKFITLYPARGSKV